MNGSNLKSSSTPNYNHHLNHHHHHHHHHHQSAITNSNHPNLTSPPSQDLPQNQPPINLKIRSGSRILISGLPDDVTAPQLHELFDQTVSPVNRVELYCDQAGISRGVALIEFQSLDAALKSHQQFHGKLIDKISTITVEIVALPASPALDPTPPEPVMTTTIQPPPHQQQQPIDQPNIPIAPAAHHRSKPAASKLSLKQRLTLPKPTPPRRFLFKTPPSNNKHLNATVTKNATIKKHPKHFVPLSQAKKRRHSMGKSIT